MNISEKTAILSARVRDNIIKGGKGLIAQSALWQVEVEEPLAFFTSGLGKRGTFVQSAQIPSAEVDDVSCQTMKVFGGEFKRVHPLLNLIMVRHNCHKMDLSFHGPDRAGRDFF